MIKYQFHSGVIKGTGIQRLHLTYKITSNAWLFYFYYTDSIQRKIYTKASILYRVILGLYLDVILPDTNESYLINIQNNEKKTTKWLQNLKSLSYLCKSTVIYIIIEKY